MVRIQTTFLVFAFLIVGATGAYAEPSRRALITDAIDEASLVTLLGNTHPAVHFARDQGRVIDSLALDHLYLQLRRAPELQQTANEFIDQLHDPTSAIYHQWLTSDEVAERFGPAAKDVRIVTRWLHSHGFTVNVVYPGNGVIDFSGSAGQVREAFHTEIHNITVGGTAHIANMSDPQVPAALASAVVGITSLHDFRPRPMVRRLPQYNVPSPGNPIPGTGSELFVLVPGDLQRIYNFGPLHAAGITGRGQTVAVLNDSDVYTLEDWYDFRKVFGLSKSFPQGSVQQIHPQPINGLSGGALCADPGVNPNGDDVETILDAEWASAAAPEAAIVIATCANTATQYGEFLALQNLISGSERAPAIISISYGDSETDAGAALNAYVSGLYQTAVLQGVSIFVASGDGGAAMSDSVYNDNVGTEGININAFASTPFNVAVGGTDFGDTYLRQTSSYWGAKNSKDYSSALSYIPEIPWNDSCASALIANFLGFSSTFGINGFCNSPTANPLFTNLYAGTGGPSGCAFGTPSIPLVVSGTCEGYPKPAYQRGVLGIPRDGVRDTPDVSLFAANGIWNHGYVFCYSDPTYGTPCVGAPSNWALGGGTSFAAPIMAGLQALINQASEPRQGNPNFVYYELAAAEQLAGMTPNCNSTLGTQVDPECIFHDVTLGDTDLPCTPLVVNGVHVGTFNCYLPGGAYGVMSESNAYFQPTYAAKPGWDFTTGLGTPNAYNLARSWPGSQLR